MGAESVEATETPPVIVTDTRTLKAGQLGEPDAEELAPCLQRHKERKHRRY